MCDFLDILRAHIARYPAMEVTDALKLLYQRVFGCGHLVKDEAACARFLADEFLSATPCGRLFESLGGGYARVHLGDARVCGVSPALLSRMFFVSATHGGGSVEAFERDAQSLKAHFDESAVVTLLAAARENGFAPFSHSQAYRDAYRPAYRVVLSAFERLLPVMSEIGRLSADRRVVVGIDGRCGAGKTTAAALMSEVFGCPVVHMDDFFLPPTLRTPERLATPGGNVDIERFMREVAAPLTRGEAFSYGAFDCAAGRVSKIIEIPRHNVTIVEGSYCLHPDARSLYDVKVFCDIDGDTQLDRLTRRDPDRVEDFVNRWIPMEEEYFDACDVRAACDFILAM